MIISKNWSRIICSIIDVSAAFNLVLHYALDSLIVAIVHGPDPEKAIFKEFVAPPLQLWFDASSRSLGHIRQHFHLLSVAKPGQ